jgi:hypothetical protein
MKYWIACTVAVCLGVVGNAQAAEGDGVEQGGLGANPTSREVREHANFSVNAVWAPLNFPFPLATGLNANYVASANWMLGVDYTRSNQAIKVFSYELGELNEQNLTLQARRFYGNSFNLKMGIGHRRTQAHLSQNFFDLTQTGYAATASELRSNFFRFGFGNQWQFSKKYTLVVDWFTVNIPFNAYVQTSASQFANSSSSKQDIENAENILKYYPSGSVTQFEVGLIF